MARIYLLQQTPGSDGARVDLRDTILIGREPDCRVVLQDDLVSRHHAEVSFKNGRALLKDLGSTNGTTINGARIKETNLRNGQSFMVGRTTFTVVEEEETVIRQARARAEAASAPKVTNFIMTDASEGSVYETRAPAPLQPVPEMSSTQPLTLEQMAKLSQRLAALNRIGNALASILEVGTLMEEVVEQVFGLFPKADRCCVLLEEGGELRPVKVKLRGRAAGGEIRLSRTVVALNRNERKAVLSFDTATDQRLSAAMSIVASGIRSIMSVPVVHKDEFFGILYLDTADIGSPFSADDLEMLASLAGQLAVFVKNARLVSQIQKETELRTNLGRYLSPSVVSEIARGNLVTSLGGETREGTVLFSDVVGFTRICRNLSAAEVVSILNRFFQDLVDAVFKYDGTVDKFGGDAMLCVWGAPVPMKDHAGPAVAAALEMQNRLYGFNLGLEAGGSTVKIRMGIGLNSGTFIAGNVGSDRRLEYTVIGDHVNFAQRVEEKATGGMVLVSDATRKAIPEAAAVRLKPTVIRGATGEFLVHSVRGIPIPVAAPPGGGAPAASTKVRALLTSLPARAGKAGSGTKVEALVVGVARDPAGPVLTVRVPAASGLAEAGALELEIVLPEVPGIPPMAGGILGTRAPEEGRPWRDVDLLVSSLPAPLDVILQPGSTWESALAPDAITRA
jgi:adenylate cyclase